MDNDRSTEIQQLAALAMETELSAPIDWGIVNVNKEEAYLLMASNVIEQLEQVPEEQRPIVAMATIAKLLVENFVLNAKLQTSNTNV